MSMKSFKEHLKEFSSEHRDDILSQLAKRLHGYSTGSEESRVVNLDGKPVRLTTRVPDKPKTTSAGTPSSKEIRGKPKRKPKRKPGGRDAI